ATLAEAMLAWSSQMYGMAGACAETMSSTSAHAFRASSGSSINAAASIALLISGTLSCGQLELFSGTTFSPLNVGSSMDCPSLKSFSQPTFGQTSGALSGTLQNFVYMMS